MDAQTEIPTYELRDRLSALAGAAAAFADALSRVVEAYQPAIEDQPSARAATHVMLRVLSPQESIQGSSKPARRGREARAFARGRAMMLPHFGESWMSWVCGRRTTNANGSHRWTSSSNSQRRGRLRAGRGCRGRLSWRCSASQPRGRDQYGNAIPPAFRSRPSSASCGRPWRTPTPDSSTASRRGTSLPHADPSQEHLPIGRKQAPCWSRADVR